MRNKKGKPHRVEKKKKIKENQSPNYRRWIYVSIFPPNWVVDSSWENERNYDGSRDEASDKNIPGFLIEDVRECREITVDLVNKFQLIIFILSSGANHFYSKIVKSLASSNRLKLFSINLLYKNNRALFIFYVYWF